MHMTNNLGKDRDPIRATRIAVTVAFQFAGGLFAAILLSGFFMLGFVFLFGQNLENAALVDYWAAVGFAVGVMNGSALGVYIIGAGLQVLGFTRLAKEQRRTGLFRRFIITVGGAVLGITIVQIFAIGAVIFLFVLPLLGALIGYYSFRFLEKKEDIDVT